VGAITAMGGVQYLVHHAYEGKPKPVGADNFDRLLKYRDIRLKEEAKVRRRHGAKPDEAFAKGFFFFCFFSFSPASPNDTARARVVSSDPNARPLRNRRADSPRCEVPRRATKARTHWTNRVACKERNVSRVVNERVPLEHAKIDIATVTMTMSSDDREASSIHL
jgi:NADH dehydrogenase (ubiquinone) 1 alpha subcomplex subunit 1